MAIKDDYRDHTYSQGFDRQAKHKHDEHEEADRFLFWCGVGITVLLLGFVWLLTNL